MECPECQKIMWKETDYKDHYEPITGHYTTEYEVWQCECGYYEEIEDE